VGFSFARPFQPYWMNILDPPPPTPSRDGKVEASQQQYGGCDGAVVYNRTVRRKHEDTNRERFAIFTAQFFDPADPYADAAAPPPPSLPIGVPLPSVGPRRGTARFAVEVKGTGYVYNISVGLVALRELQSMHERQNANPFLNCMPDCGAGVTFRLMTGIEPFGGLSFPELPKAQRMCRLADQSVVTLEVDFDAAAVRLSVVAPPHRQDVCPPFHVSGTLNARLCYGPVAFGVALQQRWDMATILPPPQRSVYVDATAIAGGGAVGVVVADPPAVPGFGLQLVS
jgi:hypothetical protein